MPAEQITKKTLEVADRFGSRNPQQLKQLKLVLFKKRPQDIFEGLFAVLCMDCENKFERHQLAGRLLYDLRPRVHLDLVERIGLTLSSWDLSIEEWPWYLVDVCGLERVLEATAELATRPLSDEERKRLDTMAWWAKGFCDRTAAPDLGDEAY